MPNLKRNFGGRRKKNYGGDYDPVDLNADNTDGLEIDNDNTGHYINHDTVSTITSASDTFTMGGSRKSRKTRKTRKSRKARKSRKSRKY